jgi:hypothetical protein
MAKALPESEGHSSELFRSGFRTLKAIKGAVRHMAHPGGPEFFHQTVLLTSNFGRSIGLLNRLLGRSMDPEPPATGTPFEPPKTLSHTSV